MLISIQKHYEIDCLFMCCLAFDVSDDIKVDSVTAQMGGVLNGESVLVHMSSWNIPLVSFTLYLAYTLFPNTLWLRLPSSMLLLVLSFAAVIVYERFVSSTGFCGLVLCVLSNWATKCFSVSSFWSHKMVCDCESVTHLKRRLTLEL